ncbi:hypothetical protein [Rhodoferax sp.]|uniref:hypothetical protein n=1 Tax=Rhodoferax sp. TaxID=50421 RepID=UPI00374D69F5
MFSLLAQYILFHKAEASSVAQRAVDAPSVANGLMESADAGAGRDPHRSAELRAAALASLSFAR